MEINFGNLPVWRVGRLSVGGSSNGARVAESTGVMAGVDVIQGVEVRETPAVSDFLNSRITGGYVEG